MKDVIQEICTELAEDCDHKTPPPAVLWRFLFFKIAGCNSWCGKILFMVGERVVFAVNNNKEDTE